MKKCKYCAEEIQDEAIRCKHCGKRVMRKKLVPRIKKPIILGIAVLLIAAVFGGVFFLNKQNLSVFLNSINFINNINPFSGVKYTQNPTTKSLPLKSIVKIIVNEGTDTEAWGSGILFTKEGHILTNAHVITNSFGKVLKDIKVCYGTQENSETKCDYKAEVVDSNFGEDLAVIKTDKIVSEVPPYLFTIHEDEEPTAEEVLDIGSKIKIAGYPGVGDVSITVTEGIVSGYKSHEWDFDDGSIHKIPDYIKTDSEINFGNSGGGAFDQENRYIGIPSYINTDDGGKIGYIIFWNRINHYLRTLVYKGDLTLNNKQYKKIKTNNVESVWWDGARAFFKEDYDYAKNKFNEYIDKSENDSKGLYYLCNSYVELEEYEELKQCAEKLRALNNSSLANSWYFTSYYYTYKDDPDYEKAYEAANNALLKLPDSLGLINWKTLAALNNGKNSEAEELNNKATKIDGLNEFTWYLKGWVAMNNNKMEEAIKYIDYSFNLSSDADTASFLAKLYDEYSEDPDNAFIYSITGLNLGSKDPDNIYRISRILMGFFNEEETYQTTFNNINELLTTVGIDKESLEIVSNIAEEDLVEYIKGDRDMKDGDKVADSVIEDYKEYIKMTISWLYTFLGEKDLCNSSFTGTAEDIVSTFESVGYSKENAINMTAVFIDMQCFCELDDYSQDRVIACNKKKEGEICGKNKIFVSNGTCMTANEACIYSYGKNVYAGNDGSCYCASGYGWNAKGTACVSICPANSFYSNGECYCNVGYRQGGSGCISNESYCNKTYGDKSFWSSYKNDCMCPTSWEYYDWWNGNTLHLFCSYSY